MAVVEATSCCSQVTDQAISPAEAEELADDFKVLADPVRLRLLSIIASVPEGEACAYDLIDPIGRSQATVSHHLSILTKAGLITREQRGKWAWFSIAPERAEFVRSILNRRLTVSLS